MSGHSKWANIKFKKGKADAEKGKVYTKMAKVIAIAAREGGADPSANSKLKEAIAKAKAQNMPNDNIDRAIKKGAGELGGGSFETVIYEGYGVGGTAVIVEALTDNKNRTAADVRHAFDKCGGNLGTNGCVSFMFDKKGLLVFLKEDCPMGEDELMELALNSGAQDFETNEDTYEITSTPEDFLSVCDATQNAGLTALSAEIAMIPQTQTFLSDPELIKKFMKMLEMFDDSDDVQNVWHNCDMPEDE